MKRLQALRRWHALQGGKFQIALRNLFIAAGAFSPLLHCDDPEVRDQPMYLSDDAGVPPVAGHAGQQAAGGASGMSTIDGGTGVSAGQAGTSGAAGKPTAGQPVVLCEEGSTWVPAGCSLAGSHPYPQKCVSPDLPCEVVAYIPGYAGKPNDSTYPPLPCLPKDDPLLYQLLPKYFCPFDYGPVQGETCSDNVFGGMSACVALCGYVDLPPLESGPSCGAGGGHVADTSVGISLRCGEGTTLMPCDCALPNSAPLTEECKVARQEGREFRYLAGRTDPSHDYQLFPPLPCREPNDPILQKLLPNVKLCRYEYGPVQGGDPVQIGPHEACQAVCSYFDLDGLDDDPDCPP